MEQMKWKKSRFKGVRYREHPVRKHGLRRDRYYAIRYQKDGKRAEEALGWESEGWTEGKAIKELQTLRENAVKGEGPTRLEEKREIERERRERKQTEKERLEKESVTFRDFFENVYFPAAQSYKKRSSCDREDGLYRLWLRPAIGNIPLRRITPLNLEKIKQGMLAKKLSPRSVEYALAIVRQVLNYARDKRIIEAVPVIFTRRQQARGEAVAAGKVIIPKVDNQRMRYLTPAEADMLLKALKEKSQDVHDMALLGLYGGLRFSESANLKWGNVDMAEGKLTIGDAKTVAGRREVYLTAQAKDMLAARKKGNPGSFVFQKRGGGKYDRISHTFWRVVEDLKLNRGVDDRKMKVCFHSTRHSYGTALYNKTRDLYIVQKALGHSQISQTARYSKVEKETLREAARAIEQAFDVKTGQMEETLKQSKKKSVSSKSNSAGSGRLQFLDRSESSKGH